MPLHPLDIVELRNLAAGVVSSHGWKTDIWTGQRRAGASMRPQVVRARKGKAKVVIEIPPLSISTVEVIARQRQYDQAGIRCLWLLPNPAFPVSKDLPAAFVDRGEEGFIARLPGQNLPSAQRSGDRASDWQQTVPIEQLLEAAFSGAFWFGNLRQGRQARVRLDGEFTKCEACGEWTNQLRAVEILSAYAESHFVVYRLEHIPPHLLGELVPHSLEPAKVGSVRPKYVRAEKRTRVVNSCIKCGQVLPGQGDITQVSNCAPITQFDITVSERLAAVTSRLPSARWRIS